ncbi:mucin-5AC isoform X1 [Alosa alosa]|uniref:mucin-5AC isoform X1 n=1 Tax=Alosa alosa TaxID=278164 RepID=UPI00201507DA|nr:mucin-5AC isoform X1 [Alosa alosa]
MFGSVKKIISAFEIRRQARPVSLPPPLPSSISSSHVSASSPSMSLGSPSSSSSSSSSVLSKVSPLNSPVNHESRPYPLRASSPGKPCLGSNSCSSPSAKRLARLSVPPAAEPIMSSSWTASPPYPQRTAEKVVMRERWKDGDREGTEGIMIRDVPRMRVRDSWPIGQQQFVERGSRYTQMVPLRADRHTQTISTTTGPRATSAISRKSTSASKSTTITCVGSKSTPVDEPKIRSGTQPVVISTTQQISHSNKGLVAKINTEPKASCTTGSISTNTACPKELIVNCNPGLPVSSNTGPFVTATTRPIISSTTGPTISSATGHEVNSTTGSTVSSVTGLNVTSTPGPTIGSTTGSSVGSHIEPIGSITQPQSNRLTAVGASPSPIKQSPAAEAQALVAPSLRGAHPSNSPKSPSILGNPQTLISCDPLGQHTPQSSPALDSWQQFCGKPWYACDPASNKTILPTQPAVSHQPGSFYSPQGLALQSCCPARGTISGTLCPGLSPGHGSVGETKRKGEQGGHSLLPVVRHKLDLPKEARTRGSETAFLSLVLFCRGGSGNSAIAIDNKIEQAMDLVKTHLMLAVREEVELLREQIKELTEKNAQLERENYILKALRDRH